MHMGLSGPRAAMHMGLSGPRAAMHTGPSGHHSKPIRVRLRETKGAYFA